MGRSGRYKGGPCEEAEARGIDLGVIRLPEMKKGFVVFTETLGSGKPLRVGDSHPEAAKDYERLPQTVEICISSILPASCFTNCSSRHRQVHDTLKRVFEHFIRGGIVNLHDAASGLSWDHHSAVWAWSLDRALARTFQSP